MKALEILTEAIKNKKQIEFEYNKSGHPKGKRQGNPHALYIHSRNTNNISIDIYQTNGISSNPSSIPGWRPFLLEHIENIEILNNLDSFKIAKGYNPYSTRYQRVIEKI